MSSTHQVDLKLVVSISMEVNFGVRLSLTYPIKVAWSVCRVRVPRSIDSRYLLVLPSSVEVQDVVDPPGGSQLGRFDFDGGEFWRASIFSIVKKDGMVRLSRSRTSKYRLEVPAGPAFVGEGAGCRRPTKWTSSWSFRFGWT